MVLRARDVMTSRVVSVRPDTTIERARYLLTENRFSALPVVDGRYRLVGIVSTIDLLRADSSPRSPETVGDVMTPDPLSLAPDATVRVIAHRLRHYGELRVMPIVEGGRGGMLAGVVSRGDLLTPEPAGGPLGRFRQRLRRRDPREWRPWAEGGIRTGPTAADIMTPVGDVVDLTEDMPVATAAAVMRERRVTAMPVLDADGHVLGILSEADLVPDTLSGDRARPAHTVGDAMTREVTCVRDTCPVPELAHSLAANRRRTLPVLDADDRMVGIVSRGDVLRATAPASGEG
ncbi:HPP family protein [Actinomycetospora rhizophila]|uniref:HPP family protein n=1 Tax=Actinomycetospora rhizophila TaxID=1416876 RepID=A0ABV9ZGB0_9PSEU